MTYESDQQLAADGLKPLADIPNREGARLYLRTRCGANVFATVRKHHVTQQHFCDYDGAEWRWSDFIGWRPA